MSGALVQGLVIVLVFVALAAFMLARSKKDGQMRPNAQDEWRAFAAQVNGAYTRKTVGWEDSVTWQEAGWTLILKNSSAPTGNSNTLDLIHTTTLSLPLQLQKPFELHTEPKHRAPEIVLIPAQGQPMLAGDSAFDDTFEARASDPNAAKTLLLSAPSKQMLERWDKLELHIGAQRNLLAQAESGGAGQLVMQMQYEITSLSEMQQWRAAALNWANTLRALGIAK